MKNILKNHIKEELDNLQFISHIRYYLSKALILSICLSIILCGTYSIATYGIKLGYFIGQTFGMFWKVNYYLTSISIASSLILAFIVKDE